MKIVAGTPSSRAAHATACPWLPGARRDDAGRALARRDSAAILLTAPRILNEPVRCRFSAFSARSRPASREKRLGGVDRRHARDAVDPRARRLDVSERRSRLVVADAVEHRARGSRAPRSAGRARARATSSSSRASSGSPPTAARGGASRAPTRARTPRAARFRRRRSSSPPPASRYARCASIASQSSVDALAAAIASVRTIGGFHARSRSSASIERTSCSIVFAAGGRAC